MTTALSYIIVITVSVMILIIMLMVIYKISLKFKDAVKDKTKNIYVSALSGASKIIPSDKRILITILICSTLFLCSNIISNQNRYELGPGRIFDTRTGDIYLEKTIDVNKDDPDEPAKFERVWIRYDFSDKVIEEPEE